MKIAEALAERSDCQNRLEELKKRLVRLARVQEGEQPTEDPLALLAEMDRTFAREGDACLRLGEPESAALRIPIEPAGIDPFVQQLAAVNSIIGASAKLPMAI